MKAAHSILVLLLILKAVSAADSLVLEYGFEPDATNQGWECWGSTDIREDFYGIRAPEGQSFALCWHYSGWFKDFSIEPETYYELTASALISSEQPFSANCYAEIKLEWYKSRDEQTGTPSVLAFRDTGNEGHYLIGYDQWTDLTIPAVLPPPDATRGRIVLVSWNRDGDDPDGCPLFDHIRLSAVSPPKEQDDK